MKRNEIKSLTIFACVLAAVGLSNAEYSCQEKADMLLQANAEVRHPGDSHAMSRTGLAPDAVHDNGTAALLTEFLIDSNLIYLPEKSYKQTVAAAFDGANYLVVWADERRGDNYDIYGARITPEGLLLDSSGIMIASAFSGRKWPAVAFDGTNYLVVWTDWRNYEVADIYGARVTPSGTVLDPSGIPISTANDPQVRCSVAFDGTNYLVVWDDYRVGWPFNDIYGARVTTDGTVLDPDGIPVCTEQGNQTYPSIAFDGSDYLVVWDDARSGILEIYGSRIDTAGSVLDPGGIPISSSAGSGYGAHPRVAFGSATYLVVWDDGNSDIVGTRVSPGGSVLDNAIPISAGNWQDIFPAITFNGTNYLVAWDDYRDTPGQYKIYGTLVSTSGSVLDPAGIKIFDQYGGWQDAAGIASDGTSYLTAMVSSYVNVYGVRMDSLGMILDQTGILVSYAAYAENSPAISFDSTNYLAVWQDCRNGNWDLYGARVTAAGSVLDPDSMPIAVYDSTQSAPSIGFDGGNYFVVWQDRRNATDDIFGARVSPSGYVVDSAGIAVCAQALNQQYPSVAFNGTNYFAVWQDYRNGLNYDIYGARIDTSGSVLDPAGIQISTAAMSQTLPSVASGDTGYFVVWQDYRNSSYEIYGARVSASANVLDPSGIAIATGGPCLNPQVAFDGENYFAVWGAGLSYDQDIYGARISQDGIVLDPGGITIAGFGSNQCYPHVVYDGTNYLVTWQDQRNADNYDIYCARVTTEGTVLDPAGLELVNQPCTRTNPAAAKGPANQLMLVFEGFIAAPYCNTRIFGALCEDVGVEEESENQRLGTENLKLSVYPNPFRHTAVIRYSMLSRPASQDEAGDARYSIEKPSLKIYNAVGRLVRSFDLASRIPYQGSPVVWDGTDDLCRKVPTGIYFIKLETGKSTLTEEVILIR